MQPWYSHNIYCSSTHPLVFHPRPHPCLPSFPTRIWSNKLGQGATNYWTAPAVVFCVNISNKNIRLSSDVLISWGQTCIFVKQGQILILTLPYLCNHFFLPIIDHTSLCVFVGLFVISRGKDIPAVVNNIFLIKTLKIIMRSCGGFKKVCVCFWHCIGFHLIIYSLKVYVWCDNHDYDGSSLILGKPWKKHIYYD